MPEDIAEEFDDWSDELDLRVQRGELSSEEAGTLAVKRAIIDAKRAAARGYPKGEAAKLRTQLAGKTRN